MPEIIVHMLDGRTTEQKKLLMKNLTKAVKDTLSVPEDHIIISLIETPKSNKSRGGISYEDM